MGTPSRRLLFTIASAQARSAAHLHDKGAFFDAAGQLTYVPPGPARRPKREDKYKRVY